ncbi:hypothetical protein HWC54_gp203 [Klebsiella phage Marfa]|uniref:Uncharacterized protein n=1 Tax=Klebsiella phage Marfa TaxID=2587809 RepID=A0A4Y5TS94_9CAUD|nr:hypothetical protein HWC54_gp203 [Klebsiella phage Marfa]QDB71869.1 hypothetical protein CPT_Marfa_224 [Klebsiella phage Marfa]QYC52913.1 hypothetical protein [Klebsiella phage vB_KpnM_TU02]
MYAHHVYAWVTYDVDVVGYPHVKHPKPTVICYQSAARK